MGTRHLILVYYKGQYHIAQYGQWDGYPGGQGVTVLHFVSDPAKLAKLTAVLDAGDMLYEPTDEELQRWSMEMSRAAQAHYLRGNGLTTQAELEAWVRVQFPGREVCPSISRDTGAEILEVVANATEPVPIVKSLDFITDGLFCEWAYVVDLDEGAMEVYMGRGEMKGESRFKKEETLKDAQHFPALVGRWKFSDLPTEAEFVRWFSGRK